MAWAGRVEALLARHWWQPRPTLAMQCLRPLSWLYALLAALAARRRPQRVPVPVVVVGNLVAGGAGKTPTVIAVVQALRQAGWRPGVVSRGHGRASTAVLEVTPASRAADTGDEPLLIRRRSGAPVWVGRDRVAAARALCRAHPEVDVLVADDGLQHAALARDVEILLFDERGQGNGLRLPAGPLRTLLPARLGPRQLLLYNAMRPSTPLRGPVVGRGLGPAVPLAAWQAGTSAGSLALAALCGRRLLAVAGIAAPERFFTMLEAAGLTLQRLPLGDHHDYATLPWPATTTELLTTEKDAVKLSPAAVGDTRVWVVGLDFTLPAAFTRDLLRRLGQPRRR